MIDFVTPTLRRLYCRLPYVRCTTPGMSASPRTCLGVLLDTVTNPVTYFTSNLFTTAVYLKSFIQNLFCKLLVGKPCNHLVIPEEDDERSKDYGTYLYYLHSMIFFGGLVALAAVISKIVKSNKRRERSKFTNAGSNCLDKTDGQNLINSTKADNFSIKSFALQHKT